MILNIDINIFLDNIAPNEIFFVYHDQEINQYTKVNLPEEFEGREVTVKKLMFGYLVSIHEN